jgi:hypothetical protein
MRAKTILAKIQTPTFVACHAPERAGQEWADTAPTTGGNQ